MEIQVRDPKINKRDPVRRLFNPVLTEEESKEIYKKLGIKYEPKGQNYERFKKFIKH